MRNSIGVLFKLIHPKFLLPNAQIDIWFYSVKKKFLSVWVPVDINGSIDLFLVLGGFSARRKAFKFKFYSNKASEIYSFIR